MQSAANTFMTEDQAKRLGGPDLAKHTPKTVRDPVTVKAKGVIKRRGRSR